MSKLENSILGVQAPVVDSRISSKIHFVTTCVIPENIVSLFKLSFEAIADQMNFDGITIDQIPMITCIFTTQEKIGILFDENQESICMTLCVYRVDRICRHSIIHQLVIIVEELTHIIWNISNEYYVCFKVFDIVKRIFPDVKINDLYNMNEAEKYK